MLQPISEWEPWAVDAIPTEGDVAIDVGAGWGIYTMPLSQRFKKVIAVEPHPMYAKSLRENMRSNVEVVQAAAHQRTGKGSLDLYLEPSHTSSHRELTIVNRGRSVGRLDVELTRLDAIPIEGHVDFVKVDVEGAEIEVWKGATKFHRDDQPPIWFIEVHSRDNYDKMQDLAHQWDYSMEVLHRLQDQAFWVLARKGRRV